MDNRQALESIVNRRNKKSTELPDNSFKPCHHYNTRSSAPVSEIGCQQCRANAEYVSTLKHALTEVLEQNDALRARVAELEAVISQSEDDIMEKNAAITQLEQTVRRFQKNNKKNENHRR